MTDKVVAFEMNATSRGPALRPTVPDRPSTPRHSNRALARAQLASVYAGLIGHDLAVADLVESLQPDPTTGALGLADLSAALGACGLTGTLERITSLNERHLPALAEMTSGQIVLVLSLDDACVQIYDTTCPDMRAEVSSYDFAQVYAGRVLRAKTSMADLEKRHAVSTGKGHWFWSELQNYRRQMLEVAAGSLVANLLAVSVSLFSMQVYDRVIPYQSEPTLWVLAWGAMLAIVLEAALKLARSGLMDVTGKRIELTVQSRLMGKLLGMKTGPGQTSPSQVFTAMREFSSVREFFTSSTIGTLADLPFILIFLALVGA